MSREDVAKEMDMYLDSGVLVPGGSTAQWLYFIFHIRGKF